MRKLTLKRKKTITASIMKIGVFIEDGEGELVLRGVNCKKIGTLKNGEKGEYEITEESVRVFVVYSRTVPDKFHFCYQIPAGDKEVELFTAPTLSPLRGNPFEIFSRQDLTDSGRTDGW